MRSVMLFILTIWLVWALFILTAYWTLMARILDQLPT